MLFITTNGKRVWMEILQGLYIQEHIELQDIPRTFLHTSYTPGLTAQGLTFVDLLASVNCGFHENLALSRSMFRFFQEFFMSVL